MHLLNRYFTPFALILTLSAIYFSEPQGNDARVSLAILGISILVNWWISSMAYRFVGHSRLMRNLQVWLNFLWSLPLVYLLVPYWAPMWLLFAMAPATAALTMSWWATLATSLASAGTLLGVYYFRSALEGAALGMACVHASFIVILALFIHALAQTALKLRDARL